MDNLLILIQLVIAFGIFNVWIVRVNKATAWRGGNATTMAEEFRVYGLSDSMRSIVGALKLSSAALVVIGVLMLAAVYMHFKVADPVRKSIPAFTMFMLSMAVLLFRG
jgi:hypothetical protein